MTRNGKIARLPRLIRDELNQRLENSQEGPKLLAWLNGLEQVKEVLEDSFDSAPISKQNLSEWRRGGFREWAIRREWIEQARQLTDGRDEMDLVLDRSLLPGALATAMATRYAALLNSWDGEPNPKFEEKLRLLRGLNQDIALLQKTLQQTIRQEKAAQQAEEDREKRDEEETRKKTLDVLMSFTERDAIAATLGGGPHAQWLAEAMIAVKYDLPFPAVPPRSKAEPDKEKAGSTSQTQAPSNEHTESPTQEAKVDLGPTEHAADAASPGESGSVKPVASSETSAAASETAGKEGRREHPPQSEDQNMD